jgi:hypothetical protein
VLEFADFLFCLDTLCRSFRDIPLLGVLSEKLPERKRLGDFRVRSVESLGWFAAPPSPSSPLLGPPGSASAGTPEECRRDSLCAISFTLPALSGTRIHCDVSAAEMLLRFVSAPFCAAAPCVTPLHCTPRQRHALA